MSNAPESQPEYDIVFAGGGTTACVIAGRLAKADPSLKILLLEAGPHTKDVLDHIQPGRFFRHLRPNSNATTMHITKPNDAVGGRNLYIHTGRCVGGGSAVNFLLYNRASASDYDDWEEEFNNPGWGSKDLIPLLQKAETYQVSPDMPTHGYSGPLKVSLGGHFDITAQQFGEVGSKVEKDRPLSNECNSLHADSLNVFSRVPKWIDEKTGKRQDAAHHYIYNQPENNNLQVLDGCRVKRVIFENKRAVGVEFFNDKFTRPDAEPTARIVRASRLVVVSAGTLGSSAILERSGIGAAERLKNMDIPLISDLPGVGENYQDHIVTPSPYFIDQTVDSYDALGRDDPEETQKQNTKWSQDGSGLLGSNGFDVAIKIRPHEDELQEIGVEFESRWKEYFANKPDKPVVWMTGQTRLPIIDTAKRLGLPPTKFLSGAYSITYPACYGSVHIKSDDIYAPLDFDTGFMTEPSDVAILRWAYKRNREILRRLPVYRGPVPQLHPQFPEGSDASTTRETSAVAISAPKIVYTAEDDAAIDDFHRRTVVTSWHSLGTCAMKPKELGGVVDYKLNVYGVEGLKVADVSIPPSNVNSNTYSTAVAIGEKAALLIAEELGIRNLGA